MSYKSLPKTWLILVSTPRTYRKRSDVKHVLGVKEVGPKVEKDAL